MYTVEIFFTHFAIWVKISPLGGGAHKISVQKQVRTAARGLVLIFAKVSSLLHTSQPISISYFAVTSIACGGLFFHLGVFRGYPYDPLASNDKSFNLQILVVCHYELDVEVSFIIFLHPKCYCIKGGYPPKDKTN